MKDVWPSFGRPLRTVAVTLLAVAPCCVLLARVSSGGGGVVEPALYLADADCESGDLLFRKGRSLLSRAVLEVDPGAGFSHVGLVVRRGGRALVIHVEPGSSVDPGSTVRVEPLTRYLAPAKASAAALHRVDAPAALRRRATAVALGYARRGLDFDDAYDLSTPDALYCTELVWRAYLEAGLDLVDAELDSLTVPLLQGPYLLPGRLLASRHLRPILQPRTTRGT